MSQQRGTFTQADGNVTDEFAALMVHLAAAYPTTGKLSEAGLRMYAHLLGDLTMAQVRAACAHAVRESRFFPSAAELLGYCLQSPEDAAVLAWAAFRQAAADVGAYADLDVADGAAAAALKATFGGWSEYCAMPDGPELHTRRQEFIVAYRHARRAPSPPARLLGLCSATSGPKELAGAKVWVGRIGADYDVTSTPAPQRQMLKGETGDA